MLTTNCDCVCASPELVLVPGSPGAAGNDGTDGINSFDITTSSFTCPAANGTTPVSILITNNAWVVVGQNLFIATAGYFQVQSTYGTTVLTCVYLAYAGNTAAGNTIAAGAGVSPAGTQPALAGALPTVLTDNSTGTATNTIAAGVGINTISIPIQLASMTAAAAELMTNYTLGYAFKILSLAFITTTISTGAGATMTLTLKIGANAVTGGSLALTLAGTNTLGKLTSATNITAANTGAYTDVLSIEVANGGTVFTAGNGILLLEVQNMDSANSAASFAAHINSLIAAL
jgi:hypothetical protein